MKMFLDLSTSYSRNYRPPNRGTPKNFEKETFFSSFDFIEPNYMGKYWATSHLKDRGKLHWLQYLTFLNCEVFLEKFLIFRNFLKMFFKEIFEYFQFFMITFKVTENLTTGFCRAFNSAQNKLTLNDFNWDHQMKFWEQN